MREPTRHEPTRHELRIDGRLRAFTAVGADEGPEGRALVIAFHGSTQTGAGFRDFTGRALDRLAAEGRAVVLYPDGWRGHWNDDRRENWFAARRVGIDEVAFFHALVAHAAERYRTGPVHVVGYSNGGEMVLTLLHRVPEALAGAVVISATQPVPENWLSEQGGTSPRPSPVVVVHGTADPVVPYHGGPMPWYARWLFRVSGAALSAPQTAEYLARRNGIDAAPDEAEVPSRRGMVQPARRARQRPAVSRIRYGAGPGEVVLYRVEGGGHTVPGSPPAPAILGATADVPALQDVVGALIEGAHAE
ncbi:alpha/beta fold hydrolase [Microbacterium sp. NPDC096154]|uniref:alpha/beta hydrolase family esterase n=1 Tax=Microbacterium sp. NPDC096154 TaxID=3155549 RepID=UPI0033261F42